MTTKDVITQLCSLSWAGSIARASPASQSGSGSCYFVSVFSAQSRATPLMTTPSHTFLIYVSLRRDVCSRCVDLQHLRMGGVHSRNPFQSTLEGTSHQCMFVCTVCSVDSYNAVSRITTQQGKRTVCSGDFPKHIDLAIAPGIPERVRPWKSC